MKDWFNLISEHSWRLDAAQVNDDQKTFIIYGEEDLMDFLNYITRTFFHRDFLDYPNLIRHNSGKIKLAGCKILYMKDE